MEKKEKRRNGEGSFIHLPDGKVRMRQQVGYHPNGKQRILTVTDTSETKCLKKMRDRINNLSFNNNNYVREIPKFSLTELCYKHLEYDCNSEIIISNMDDKKKDLLKPKAVDRRKSTIRNQISKYEIGNKKINSVTSNMVKNHIEYLIRNTSLSISSIEKTLDVINAAYRWAIEQGYSSSNPCTAMIRKTKKTLKKLETRNSSDGIVRVLSPEQIVCLEEFILERNDKIPYQQIMGLSILLLLYTGMRVGEMCALRWNDWIIQSQSLDINKTRYVSGSNAVEESYSVDQKIEYRPGEGPVKNDKARTIKLSDKATEVLMTIKSLSPKINSDDYIVINKKFNPTNPSNYGVNINKIYLKAGLGQEITGAHILRRTFATSRFNEGKSLEKIASYIGDTPDTVKKHYLCLTKKVMSGDKILNIVDMDD